MSTSQNDDQILDSTRLCAKSLHRRPRQSLSKILFNCHQAPLVVSFCTPLHTFFTKPPSLKSSRLGGAAGSLETWYIRASKVPVVDLTGCRLETPCVRRWLTSLYSCESGRQPSSTTLNNDDANQETAHRTGLAPQEPICPTRDTALSLFENEDGATSDHRPAF